jgi:hypothetical protein
MALSVKKAAKALMEHDGVVLYAAEACGVSRQYFNKFMRQHPELEEVREEAGEVLLDIGDKHISKEMRAGNTKVVLWYQERKGKNRGYSTRQEQTGADGGPLEFEAVERRIVDPENGEPQK